MLDRNAWNFILVSKQIGFVTVISTMVAMKEQKHNCKNKEHERHVKILTIVLETNK